MLAPGHVIKGTYRVEHLLGEGGMAQIYAVSHMRMPRRFALKLIAPDHASHPNFYQRFEREAKILASLSHPHVVNVVDYDQTEDHTPFLVMELLEGQSLSGYLAQSGPLPPGTALAIARQIGEALQAAHAAGVVHRDLKPDNVFLVRNGPLPLFVKVLDFGIAKSAVGNDAFRTGSAALLGTPAYMSPEQALGKLDEVDWRSDQFALAAILYEMLTGRPAFAEPNDPIYKILERVAQTTPPSLPPPLSALQPPLWRALNKDKAARYPSISEFLQTLEQKVPPAAPPAQSTLPGGEMRPRPRWKTRRLAPLLGVGLAMAGIVAWRTRPSSETGPVPTPSHAAAAEAPDLREPHLDLAPQIDLPPLELAALPARAAPIEAPPLPDKSARPDREKQARLTRPIVTISAVKKPEQSAKIQRCLEREVLAKYQGGGSFQVVLERSGALHVTSGPSFVMNNQEFSLCLRDALGSGPSAPERAVITVKRTRSP